jgi:hypothetical protein
MATISGATNGLDSEQIQNAKTIAAVGKHLGATSNDIAVAIMTSMDESSLHNLHGGDRDSQGLFQQRPSQGWGSVEQVTNPVYAATKFYQHLLSDGSRAQKTPWQQAQDVQISAYSDGSKYQKYWASPANGFQVSAQQIAAYVLGTNLNDVLVAGGGSASSSTSTTTSGGNNSLDVVGDARSILSNAASSIPNAIKAVAAPLTIMSDFFHKLLWIFTPSHFIKLLLYLNGFGLVLVGLFLAVYGAGKDRPA